MHGLCKTDRLEYAKRGATQADRQAEGRPPGSQAGRLSRRRHAAREPGRQIVSRSQAGRSAGSRQAAMKIGR